MGNFRQHVTFASGLGVLYAAGLTMLAGIHWLYASVSLLLAALGGMLPDLDSDSGIEMRGFSGWFGVMAALIVFKQAERLEPRPGFELLVLVFLATYAFCRHMLRRIMARITVHRGMCHSIPTCLVYGELAYLYYPSESVVIRLAMALALMLGFLSHLLLDEICSVDLRGARVNKAFGTAMKFWANSPWSTLAVYAVLGYLSYRVIETWPGQSAILSEAVPRPAFPWVEDLVAWLTGQDWAAVGEEVAEKVEAVEQKVVR